MYMDWSRLIRSGPVEVPDKEYSLEELSPKFFELFHDDIVSFIIKAMGYLEDKWSIDDVMESLKEGKMQGWIIYDKNHGVISGICITEVIEFPKEKVLNITGLGGNGVSEWIHLISGIEEFAHSKGCKAVELYGRPGWKKLLAENGYKKYRVVLRRSIKE